MLESNSGPTQPFVQEGSLRDAWKVNRGKRISRLPSVMNFYDLGKSVRSAELKFVV